MYELKSHPLEAEVDKTIRNFGLDATATKQVHDTGTLYNFTFCETPIYIALPTYIKSRHDSLVRAEFTVGIVAAKDVGRLLLAIALDFDMHRHHPIRAVSRTKDDRLHTILLQFVCSVDLMQSGFLATTISFGVELTQCYRDTLLIRDQAS